MGYYSDVAISMYESDYKKLCESADAAGEEIRNFLNRASIQETPVDDDAIAVTLVWCCVKWRYDYNDVKFVEDFLKTISDYSFKRIGESATDIEERSKGDDYYELCDVVHFLTTGRL